MSFRSKIRRGLQKTTGWKSGNEGETEKSLAEWKHYCVFTQEQAAAVERRELPNREKLPLTMPWPVGRQSPTFPDTSLLLTSCRSFSRSGIFSLCASVPYSHCSLSQAVPISSQGYCMKRIHSLRPNSSITYPPWFLVFHFRPHWFSLWWHFHDSPFWLQAAPLSATLMKLKSPKSPT